MTQAEGVDAIMKVMQDFVDSERLKVWNLHLAWRDKAERFIQHFIDQEANSPPDSLNQVYVKGVFAAGSVRSVRDHARELLKEKNPDLWSRIQTQFPFGHRHFCTYGVIDDKLIPCNCGLHDALRKIEEKNDE